MSYYSHHLYCKDVIIFCLSKFFVKKPCVLRLVKSTLLYLSSMITLDSKYSTTAEYVSLFAMIALTVVAIFNKSISVFYIIYLFWWDEFLKTIFDTLRYWFKKELIDDVPRFKSNTRGRMFFLFIYFVFIVLCFGFMLDWDNKDLMILNFRVLFFNNALFDFTIFSFLLREIYLYRNQTQKIDSHSILSRGIITLHISIILGIFAWFFLANKFPSLKQYSAVLAITPFLLFKIFFEMAEIKENNRLRKSSGL